MHNIFKFNIRVPKMWRRKFNSPENLNVHTISDHEKESNSSFTMLSDGSLTDALLFRCEICLNVYESSKDLEDHAKVIHNSEFVHNDSFDIENAEIVIISNKVDDVQQEMNSMPRKRKTEPNYTRI